MRLLTLCTTAREIRLLRKGKEEADERRKAREERSQAAYQASQASKVQNAINNKPIYKVAPEDLKKNADVLTVKAAEKINSSLLLVAWLPVDNILPRKKLILLCARSYSKRNFRYQPSGP